MSPAVPVVMDVTVTAEALELSMSILPVPVESAAIDVAEVSSDADAPMPVAASKLRVVAVRSAPPSELYSSIEPIEVTVMVSPVAVTLSTYMLPLVVVVRVIFFEEPPAVTVPNVRLPESLVSDMRPSVVAAFMVVCAPNAIGVEASVPILPAEVRLMVVPEKVPDDWVISEGAVTPPIVIFPAEVMLLNVYEPAPSIVILPLVVVVMVPEAPIVTIAAVMAAFWDVTPMAALILSVLGAYTEPMVSAPPDIVRAPSVRVLLKSIFVAAVLVIAPIVNVPAPALVMHILGCEPDRAVRVAAFTFKFLPLVELPMSEPLAADRVNVPAVIVSELLP